MRGCNAQWTAGLQYLRQVEDLIILAASLTDSTPLRLLEIPVFHDDQHGTAIAGAGPINALHPDRPHSRPGQHGHQLRAAVRSSFTASRIDWIEMPSFAA